MSTADTITTPAQSADSQKEEQTFAGDPKTYDKYIERSGLSAKLLADAGLKLSELIKPWYGEFECEDRELAKARAEKAKEKYFDPRPGLAYHPKDGLLVEYQPCLDKKYRARIRFFGTAADRTYTPEAKSEHEGTRSFDNCADPIILPKWLSTAGEAAPYLRAIPETAWTDTSVPLAIVEAPVKAMALAQCGLAAVGMGGADAGLCQPQSTKLNREASRIKYDGRRVYVMMDSGQERNPSVALGAGRVLKALNDDGADVRLCYLPEADPGDEAHDAKAYDQGPDDYLRSVYRSVYKKLENGLIFEGLDSDEGALAMIEEQARWFAQVALMRVLSSSVPGKPWERVTATPKAERDDLLRDLPFLASLRFLSKAEFERTSKAWGGKRDLAAALKDYEALLAKKAEEQQVEAAEYEVRDGALYTGDMKIANFTAKIVEEVQTVGENAALEFRIEGKTEKGVELPLISVPAAEFRKMEWPLQKWGQAAVISAGRATADHVRAAIQVMSTPTRKTVYSSYGWHLINGKWVYLLPGGGIGADGHVDVEVAAYHRYQRPELPADDDDALAAVERSLQVLNLADDKVTTPIMAAIYLGPIASLLEGVDYTTFLVGRSGCHKSTVAGLVLSHYGMFDHRHLPLGWVATANSLEHAAHTLADMPLVVDNGVPAQTGKEQIEQVGKMVRFIQAVGDQQDRARLDREANARARRAPRCVAMATSEILPPANESTLGRCLIVQMERGGVDLDLLTEYQADRETLGRALAGYIRWIAQWDRAELTKHLAAMKLQMRGDILAKGIEGHTRAAEQLSLALCGYHLFLAYARTVGLSREDSGAFWARAQQGLAACADAQPAPVHASAAGQWVTAFLALMQRGAIGLAADPSWSLAPKIDLSGNHARGPVLVGWLKGGEIILDTTAAYLEVTKFLGAEWRYSELEWKRQLKDEKLMVGDEAVKVVKATDGKHLEPKRTCGGVGTRRLVLDRRILGGMTGLYAVEEDEESGTVSISNGTYGV